MSWGGGHDPSIFIVLNGEGLKSFPVEKGSQTVDQNPPAKWTEHSCIP